MQGGDDGENDESVSRYVENWALRLGLFFWWVGGQKLDRSGRNGSLEM